MANFKEILKLAISKGYKPMFNEANLPETKLIEIRLMQIWLRVKHKADTGEIPRLFIIESGRGEHRLASGAHEQALIDSLEKLINEIK